MTETKYRTHPRPEADANAKGILFYDGTCRFCRDGVGRFHGALAGIGVETRPFENGAGEAEMKLRWHDGTVRGGADAAFFLARRLWWAAPLGWLEWIPGCRAVARKLYRFIADRRHCGGSGEACRIEL